MRPPLSVAAATALTLLVSAQAKAAEIALDQQTVTTNYSFGTGSSGDHQIAQSFTAGSTGILGFIQFGKLDYYPPTGDVFADILPTAGRGVGTRALDWRGFAMNGVEGQALALALRTVALGGPETWGYAFQAWGRNGSGQAPPCHSTRARGCRGGSEGESPIAAVPDAGSSLLLFATALAALSALRRRE